MACQVLNPHLNSTMDLYHQGWNHQPLSPDMSADAAARMHAHSPVGSCCSPVSIHSPLTHDPVGMGSPIAANSPLMQAHSPLSMHGSPLIKHEGEHYADVTTNLSNLLRCTMVDTMPVNIPVTSAGCMMGTSSRELLDGKKDLASCSVILLTLEREWRVVSPACRLAEFACGVMFRKVFMRCDVP